jgi:hypothetical protein
MGKYSHYVLPVKKTGRMTQPRREEEERRVALCEAYDL